MTNATGPDAYIGRNAVDPQGDKIGSVGQVYLNDETGQPDWITVNTGLFGTKEHFAPLAGSSFNGDALVLPFDKSVVKDAPDVADASHLDVDEQEALYAYYDRYLGAGYGAAGTVDYDRTTDVDVDRTRGVGHDTSGPNTDDAMTRSEEHLRVGTEQVAAGRARLRKYVVTEQQSVQVPVTREEVRIEREPITDANRGAALSGGEITEEEHEVVLHAERPVVQTEAVPVERVRLGTETITEQETVTGEVRKEQIEVDDDVTTSTSNDRRRNI
ncbi:PRC and DUF2382 domain-containing protein [Nakamurella sp. GG22]